MIIFVASGGTGGHIMPALCVAKKMIAEDFELYFLGDDKCKNYIKNEPKINYYQIKSSQIQGNFFKKIKAAIKILSGILQSIFLIITKKPKYIICFGGYATFPIGIAAILLKSKLIIHEQNSHIGRVNKIFAKYAKKIATTFPVTYGLDNSYKDKISITGNPIREEIANLKEKDYKLPEFAKFKLNMESRFGYDILLKSDFQKIKNHQREFFNILVIGGSGGAQIFSEILPKSFFNLKANVKENICIFQQCRSNLIEQTFKEYKSFNINIIIDSFFENMSSLIANSHLIIARSGSSTLFEISAAKKPTILVPFAKSADNHQLKNAQFFANNEAAILIEEKDFTINNVTKLLNELIINKKKLELLSSNIAKLAKFNCEQEILNLIKSG